MSQAMAHRLDWALGQFVGNQNPGFSDHYLGHLEVSGNLLEESD